MTEAHAQVSGLWSRPPHRYPLGGYPGRDSRVDGKPTQRHIAYLGGITESAIELPAQRAFFWQEVGQEVAQQLDQLTLSKDDRARIEAAVGVKVPRLTRQEYNEWLIHRDGLGMDFGKPPTFRVCGVPARR